MVKNVKYLIQKTEKNLLLKYFLFNAMDGLVC